jgi:hypothetical protein
VIISVYQQIFKRKNVLTAGKPPGTIGTANGSGTPAKKCIVHQQVFGQAAFKVKAAAAVPE